MAIVSSSAGVPGSPEISEAPPMGSSTMSRTVKPRRWATKLWDSSWITMQTKSAAIHASPSTSERVVVRPPFGRTTRSTSSGKLQWRRIGTPLMLPIRSDLPISSFNSGARQDHPAPLRCGVVGGVDLQALDRFSPWLGGRLLVDIGPLRESQPFRRLWSGYLVTTLGSQLTVVAIPYQVFKLTHSSLDVGLIGLAQIVPVLGGSLFGGSIADAVDRRRVLLATQLTLAACSVGLALNAAVAHAGALAPVRAERRSRARVASIDTPTRSAVFANLVARPMFASANALLQLLFQVGQVAGPAVAGLLLGQVGIASVYWIDAATFAVSFLAVASLPALRPEGGGTRFGLRSIAEGLRYLKGRPVLQGTFVIDLNAMVLGMPRALFPALGLTRFHGGAATVGLLYAAPGAGALIGAVLTGWVVAVRKQGRAVLVAVTIWGLAIAAFGLVPWLGAALVLLAVAGAADVVSAVFRGTILQLEAPEALRGRLSSIHTAVVTGGPRLGDFEAGAVAAVSTPQISVVSGGLGCVVGRGPRGLADAEIRPLRRRRGRGPRAARSPVCKGRAGERRHPRGDRARPARLLRPDWRRSACRSRSARARPNAARRSRPSSVRSGRRSTCLCRASRTRSRARPTWSSWRRPGTERRPTVAGLADRLAGKVVVSMANALARVGDELEAVVPARGSVCVAVQQAAPGALVAGAFHHLPARGPREPRAAARGGRPRVLGPRRRRRGDVALVDRMPGCRGIDAGTLSAAAAIEAFTAVLVGVNIRQRSHASIRLTGLRTDDDAGSSLARDEPPVMRLYDTARREVVPFTPGRGRDDVHLRHHALRRGPPRPRRGLPHLRRPAAAAARPRPRDRCACATSPTSTTTSCARPASSACTTSTWRRRRSPASTQTWRRSACCPRSPSRGRRRRSPTSSASSAWSSTPATPTRPAGPSTSTSRRFPRFGQVSHLDRDEMLELAAEHGGRPDDPFKDDPLDFVLWQPSRAGRAGLGVAVGAGPAGLAHRVLGARDARARRRRSTCTAGAATSSSRTTSARRRSPRRRRARVSSATGCTSGWSASAARRCRSRSATSSSSTTC